MFKKTVFILACLNFMKPLTNGFIIGENDRFNQWLQPFDIISAPFKKLFSSDEQSSQNQHESNSSQDNIEIKDSENESPKPVSDVLKTLQTEIDKADENEKKFYEILLSDLEQKLAQKTRYVRVFFKNMWHMVDLGLYGSSQRARDTSTVETMLKPIKDLLKWLYKNAYDLLTWNIAIDDEVSPPSTTKHDADGIKVTTKRGESGEDNHKITHRFEMDPFVVKLDMNILCRILDEAEHPNGSHNGENKHNNVDASKAPLQKDTKPSPVKPTSTPPANDTSAEGVKSPISDKDKEIKSVQGKDGTIKNPNEKEDGKSSDTKSANTSEQSQNTSSEPRPSTEPERKKPPPRGFGSLLFGSKDKGFKSAETS